MRYWGTLRIKPLGIIEMNYGRHFQYHKWSILDGAAYTPHYSRGTFRIKKNHVAIMHRAKSRFYAD